MIFGFFSANKKKINAISKSASVSGKRTLAYDNSDYLGLAADEGNKAKLAVKEKKYDKAWKHYHKQKSYFLKHANRSGFSPAQVLSLDSTVHEQMANVLRLEGKHEQGLTDIVYWICANSDKSIKRHDSKFKSYFDRCKFENTDVGDAFSEVKRVKGLAEYTVARSIVAQWAKRG